MIRISRSQSGGVTTLRVEGRLVEPWVEELRVAIAVEPLRARLALDLADLLFADRAGVALLQELRARGVVIASRSPFVADLLDLPPVAAP